ncbi:hypothetical protein [Klebsiella grimontii]|uniref:hypothetical protein n=1 Tax=Klebsiella grimontii TaxID=2058152 RepID=UPI001CC90F6F|nr:hypothetical protein [Klebsiella grimontii]MBZ7675401.1 hypothetical protein [Klebsiella grimontii]
MKRFVLLALPVLLAGCASIHNGTTQSVMIKTNTPAHYTIDDEDGVEVATGTAPATVSLKRGDGPYKVSLVTLDGKGIGKGVIDDSVSWWITGNIIQPIGYATDFITGAAWNLEPSITVNTVRG